MGNKSSHYFTEVHSCMSMWNQHAIADFSTSQLLFALHVGLRNTSSEKEKNSAVHSDWSIADITSNPRSPNRCIDVLNDVKANPEQPRQLYGTGTSRQLKVECQSSQGSWCLLLSLVTKRSHNTQSHYQKDEMQSWQTCQTRKMRHQDRVEGGPGGRLTLMSNKTLVEYRQNQDQRLD